VYGPLRVKARAFKDTKLRWKIPKNFPDEHRPSNGLYTVLAVVFVLLYVKFICLIVLFVLHLFEIKSDYYEIKLFVSE
jgi:hypothetical protein